MEHPIKIKQYRQITFPKKRNIIAIIKMLNGNGLMYLMNLNC